MPFEEPFQHPEGIEKLLAHIAALSERTGPLRLMEVCGTHTMAIAKAGLKSLLPKTVRLLSGPGCPVCVTPSGDLDAVFALSERPHVLLASYGDLLRVPGSKRGTSLLRQRALGAKVAVVYSPMDALALAQKTPQCEVVFLGVGFETTAPGTAACILEAAEKKVPNFSVLCLLKRTEPALRALIASPDFAVDGFLCPGHVAAILGAEAFRFLPEEYGLPAVVSGFTPGDLVYSISLLVEQCAEKRPALSNTYTRVVRDAGNPAAKAMMDAVLTPCTSTWRGLGEIAGGGFAIREAYAAYDAAKKFGFSPAPAADPPGCRCSPVRRGAAAPEDCPLFGKACTPADPVGPCMVSSEGACAAAWRYRAG